MSDCMTQEDAEKMDYRQAINILIPMQIMMTDQNGCPISDAFFALGKAVEALSAQPETATWVPESDRRNHWHCSSCGYVIGILKMDAKYCPNCGAHMEVEALRNEPEND